MILHFLSPINPIKGIKTATLIEDDTLSILLLNTCKIISYIFPSNHNEKTTPKDANMHHIFCDRRLIHYTHADTFPSPNPF